jgi:hypothetical protein
MSAELSPESKLLAHFEEIHKILGTNSTLADVAVQALEASPTAVTLRRAMTKMQRNSLSYYKEKYALALVPILQKLAEDKKPLYFLLTDFEPRISLRTLYLRVYQGWRWLMDFHPEREFYAKLWAENKIRMMPGKGISIAPEEHIEVELKMHTDVKSTLTAGQLQRHISDAIEKPVTEPTIVYEQNELSLSDDEIMTIEASVAGITGITAIVEAHRIKILKTP